MFNGCERARFELGSDTRVHTATLRDLNAIYTTARASCRLIASSSSVTSSVGRSAECERAWQRVPHRSLCPLRAVVTICTYYHYLLIVF